MSKVEVLGALDDTLRLEAVQKDGNLLAEELRRRATTFATSDRTGVVEAVREWLESNDEVRVIHAVVLIKDLQLRELLETVRRVRADVASGSFMRPSSTWVFDAAIKSLE